MNSDTDQVTMKDQDEEDLKTTPERPAFSPLTQETNEQNEKTNSSDCNGTEIKSEPQDSIINGENPANQEVSNVTPPAISEIIETLSEQNANEQIPLDTNEIRVKEESVADEAHAIDYGMPISKTPGKSNPLPFTDMETTRLLATSDGISTESPNQIQLNVLNANLAKANSLNGGQAKTALDAFLDGIATPLAPSRPLLRVKTEFALKPQTPRREEAIENDQDAKDADISPPPPPPPFISSTTSSDILADGIATPHLSLAAVNRLRVKTEFAMPPATPEHHMDDSATVPDDNFFADLLPSEEVKKETGEISASDGATEEEDIPSDYFDDLTQDKIKERIEEAKNCELEEKFSDRLKELERLKAIEEKLKEKRKNRKKQKKSKKKSHKRSRSRSLSPARRAKERKHEDFESSKNQGDMKQTRHSPMQHEMPSCSNYRVGEEMEVDCLRLGTTGIKIKPEYSTNNMNQQIKELSPVVENVEDIEENLTPKQKKERAIKRATALLNHLKDTSDDSSTIFATFPFVSTVRKLPTSHSYVQQQIYENRSPLHTVNNVSYKFNSHTTRFNMEEWGLAALPTHAAKLAQLVGCDAQFIHNKLRTIKIPAKLKKVKQEPNNEVENEEEELVETTSSLYSNAMTQTDDTGVFDGPRKTKGYEIGVQAEPEVFSIGSQTLETQSPTEVIHKDDEAPIMQIIRDLNENQLMAIHAFAELIKMPNANTNAMEMYKIQMQIMDIYKMSQKPSALATAQTQAVNNYSTTTTNTSPQRRGGGGVAGGHQQQSPIMHIKSVVAGDGTEFVMNDPRAKSATYAKRIANDGAGSSSNYDNRYSHISQHSQVRAIPNEGYCSHGRSYDRSYGIENDNRHYTNNSSTARQNQYPVNNPVPPTTTKRYGRGAARR